MVRENPVREKDGMRREECDDEKEECDGERP